MTDTETIEELEKLHARLLPQVKYISQGQRPMPSDDWRKAFDLHNLINDGNLKMGCRPCYHKVVAFLTWYINKLKKQSVSEN